MTFEDGERVQQAANYEGHYPRATRGETSSGENFESSIGTRITQEKEVSIKIEDQHNLDEGIDRET